MNWQFARLMTDDDDKYDWYYVDDDGILCDVDIRSTAEDIELAFMFGCFIIYPVYNSSADDRKYIIVDDTRGKNQNYYLYKR